MRNQGRHMSAPAIVAPGSPTLEWKAVLSTPSRESLNKSRRLSIIPSPLTIIPSPLTGEGQDGGENGRARSSLPLTLTLSLRERGLIQTFPEFSHIFSHSGCRAEPILNTTARTNYMLPLSPTMATYICEMPDRALFVGLRRPAFRKRFRLF